jgi:magnesium-transporting ATPase (P-type)
VISVVDDRGTIRIVLINKEQINAITACCISGFGSQKEMSLDKRYRYSRIAAGHGLVFVGLTGMYNPPRPEDKKAVKP